MGRLNHPAAIQARQSTKRSDFKLAAIQIEQALAAEPANPDLTCEYALLLGYTSREDEAFEFLPICSQGMGFQDLITLLANHYLARSAMDDHDHEAQRRLDLIRTFQPVESQSVGSKLSACLIVKNEEKVLKRCLKSLQGIVDEIVVVDTGSSDRTLEIAREFDAVVGVFEWCEDFAAARNFALSLATGNWILWVDADEELVPDSFTAIRSALVRPQIGGYEIEIINFLEVRSDGDQFRHCPTRLFQKLPGVTFSGRIHEQINPSLEAIGLPWRRLDGAVILHHGYRPDVMNEKSKITRTVAMLEREVREDPGNSFQWFNLANAYLVAQRYEDSVHAGKFSVKLLKPNNGFAVHAYSILIQALCALRKFPEAVEMGREAKRKGLECLQISFELCNALLSGGWTDKARSEAESMMQFEWVEGSTGDKGIFTHKRHLLFAQILLASGHPELAILESEVAITAAYEYAAGQFVHGQCLEALGRNDEARRAFECSMEDSACFKPAVLGFHRTYMQENRIKDAADIAQRAWETIASDTHLWLLWKRTLESLGDANAILKCYEAFAQSNQVSADFLIEWGRFASTAGNNPIALKCFAEAMRAAPSDPNAYFNCADVFYQMGLYSDAVQVYHAGLSLAPEHSEGWFMLGNALAKSQRVSEAQTAFMTVLEKNPSHQRAAHNLNILRAA